MMLIRVDSSSLTMVVVGLPTPKMRDGVAVTDRATGRPMFDIDVALLSDSRPETVRLAVPERGYPPDLEVGSVLTAEGVAVVTYDARGGGVGLSWRANAVKPLPVPNRDLKAVSG